MTNTCLLLIDLQNDYYSTYDGAKWPLFGTEMASNNAASLITQFRAKKMPIVHVRHESISDEGAFFLPHSEGAKIHHSVAPKAGELVILKQKINSFRDTELHTVLKSLDVKTLIIAGAMSHMCIDAVTRAAVDLGYECHVAHDACATLDLEFNGITIPAEYVHYAFMAALQFGYCNVDNSKNLLDLIR